MGSQVAKPGSEFTESMPIEPSSPAAQATDDATPSTRSARSLRILVADDNDDGREMLAYLLSREGHVVEAAEDGQQALEKAVDFGPDVAILDIGMPGLNGFDLARRLRARNRESPLLIVALSGLGQEEDKARAVEAGFDRHFTKPVDVNALLRLLGERFASSG